MNAIAYPVNILTTPPTTVETLQSLLATASGEWTGCNWQTSFGPRKMNLNGLKSSQAQLLAGATPGAESAAWEEVARYLRDVGIDATAAESAANRAVALMESGRLAEAMIKAERAVILEAKHRSPVTWNWLRLAIAGH